MRTTLMRLMIVLVGAILPLVACHNTTEPGIRSGMLSQYTTLEAGTADVTKAAASVLKDLGLQDVQSSSTNVDGWATGAMADKTPVKVTVERVSDKLSKVSAKVGSFGESSLGQDILIRIRKELGLKPPPTPAAASASTETPAK